MMKFLLTLLFLTAQTLWAVTYTPENLPLTTPASGVTYTCNPDGLLSASAVDSIDTMLSALDRSKGVKALVIVVGEVEGGDAYNLAVGVGNKRGVGTKQNTGLVIVLAVTDRSYFIATGEGLEGYLPDAICKRVENRVMVPLLREEQWDAAMVETVRTLKGLLEENEELVAAYQTDEDDNIAIMMLWVFLICVVIVAFAIWVNAYYEKRCPRCGKRTLELRDRRVYRDGIYRVTELTYECSHCKNVVVRHVRENQGNNIGGGIGGMIIGGGMGRSGGGGSFGSFGGGSFGGGGAGGRF
jgi:uncharacterized protein